MLIQTKVCVKCGEEKPLTEFYRNKRARDRKTKRCKECFKKPPPWRKPRKRITNPLEQRLSNPGRKVSIEELLLFYD